MRPTLRDSCLACLPLLDDPSVAPQATDGVKITATELRLRNIADDDCESPCDAPLLGRTALQMHCRSAINFDVHNGVLHDRSSTCSILLSLDSGSNAFPLIKPSMLVTGNDSQNSWLSIVDASSCFTVEVSQLILSRCVYRIRGKLDNHNLDSKLKDRYD